jgi:hypothetical protein
MSKKVRVQERIRDWWANAPRQYRSKHELNAWARRDPRNPLPFSLLARMEWASGRHEVARSLWLHAIKRWHGHPLNSGPIGSLWENVSDACDALGDTRGARRALGHAAAAFSRGQRERLHCLVLDDYRRREAGARAVRGEFQRAAVLLRRVRNGPNWETFRDDIAELERMYPMVRGRPRAERPKAEMSTAQRKQSFRGRPRRR